MNAWHEHAHQSIQAKLKTLLGSDIDRAASLRHHF